MATIFRWIRNDRGVISIVFSQVSYLMFLIFNLKTGIKNKKKVICETDVCEFCSCNSLQVACFITTIHSKLPFRNYLLIFIVFWTGK